MTRTMLAAVAVATVAVGAAIPLLVWPTWPHLDGDPLVSAAVADAVTVVGGLVGSATWRPRRRTSGGS